MKQVYNLDNRLFVVSNNIGMFPVNTILFSSCNNKNTIKGTLNGIGITSGEFVGHFIADDQIDILFQWLDITTLLPISGRLYGYICGDSSEGFEMYLNWYFVGINISFGMLRCIEMQDYNS